MSSSSKSRQPSISGLPPSTVVLLTAVASRLFLVTLAVLTSLVAPPYDLSTAVLLQRSKQWPEGVWTTLLQPFVRWDAVYFLAIADRWYRWEQEFAFFPGASGVAAALAACLPQTIVGLSSQQAVVLSGVLVSNVAFVSAAVVLYRLGVRVLDDRRTALRAALLFAVTPAGLFMSALYTESLFAFLSFSGMLAFSDRRYLSAAIFFSLATTVRSNGVLHAGFFVWEFLVLPCLPSPVPTAPATRHPVFRVPSLGTIVQGLVRTVFHAGLVVAPFVGFQAYAYARFCSWTHGGRTTRPWCERTVPSIYSFVQEEYWSSGFLSYYRISQIPNFVLAAPIFVLTVASFVARFRGRPTTTRREEIPFVILWAFMTVYAATMMHVQVVVRFFTSVPGLYWFCGGLEKGWKRTWVVVYFVGYGVATTVLFVGFLPPA